MLAILRWCRRGRCWRSLREPTEATLSAREAGVEHPLVEFYGVGQAPLLSPPGARQQLRDIIVYCQGQIVVVWSPVVGLEEAASGPKPRNVLLLIHKKKADLSPISIYIVSGYHDIKDGGSEYMLNTRGL